MACIQPYWSCLQLGSQHLARQFARSGFEVHYFSAPVTPLHLYKIRSPETASRFRSCLKSPAHHPDYNIKSYIPFSLIAPDGLPLLKSRVVTGHWHRTIFPSLKTILKHNNLNHVDLLYLDNLSYHFLLDEIEYDQCVFRIMDMHDHFPGWAGHTRWMAEKVASRADLTIYSALGLKTYVDSLNPGNSLLVPNGVDFDFFRSLRGSAGRHPALEDIPDPVILYTGIIDSRFDAGLIRIAAGELSDVSFVFAGPRTLDKDLEDMPENVYFIGPIDHDELPLLICSAKAGIIPFDVKHRMDLIQGIRPLKLLEYMAAGLPVISARWPEIENMNSPAWVYDDEQGFVRLIKRAISQKKVAESCIAFAERNDWSRAISLITDNL
jgi:glycosyltransferase involved in cell wall biosynthesis